MILKLTNAQAEALQALESAQPKLPFVLIGAAALSVHVPLARMTADIDLVVVAAISTFAPVLESLGWQRDAKRLHRWHAGNAVADVLPGAEEVLRQGIVRFEDGCEMNALGLDLALGHSLRVPVARFGFHVNVAALAALVVLKTIAWLDRPLERLKDLEDLTCVLECALPDDDPRRWDSNHPVGASGFSHEEQSPFHVGWEVGRIAQSAHRSLLTELLRRLDDQDDLPFGRMLRASRDPSEEAADRLRRTLSAFEAGLQAASEIGSGSPGKAASSAPSSPNAPVAAAGRKSS